MGGPPSWSGEPGKGKGRGRNKEAPVSPEFTTCSRANASRGHGPCSQQLPSVRPDSPRGLGPKHRVTKLRRQLGLGVTRKSKRHLTTERTSFLKYTTNCSFLDSIFQDEDMSDVFSFLTFEIHEKEAHIFFFFHIYTSLPRMLLWLFT